MELTGAIIQLRQVWLWCSYIQMYEILIVCYFGSVFYWLPSQSCICITQSDYQFWLLFFINQPPTVLRSNDAQTEQETVEISVTRLLLKSYYEIVSKNIQDSVPKAIMHFLVSQYT
jgi:hypothetical protein